MLVLPNLFTVELSAAAPIVIKLFFCVLSMIPALVKSIKSVVFAVDTTGAVGDVKLDVYFPTPFINLKFDMYPLK